MKTLVTGATGLVGGNLARMLVERGHAVRALARPTSNTLALQDTAVEIVHGDITDPASLRAAMEGIEIVFHCAANVSMWAPKLEPFERVNIEGTQNVCHACRDAGVRRLIHCSTVDAIGFGTRDNPADETRVYDNDRYGVAYMTTKHVAQTLVLEQVKGGLDAVIVNPTYMFGAWDTKPTSGQMILEVAAGKAVGYTTGGNNFIDVEDVADAMIAAVEKGQTGELYILGNNAGNLTYREIFTLIAGIVGARPPKFAIPRAASAIGGWVGDLYGHLSGREPQINSVTARLGYVDHYFTADKAIRELGLRQTPVETAIRRAWDFFVLHNYAKRKNT